VENVSSWVLGVEDEGEVDVEREVGAECELGIPFVCGDLQISQRIPPLVQTLQHPLAIPSPVQFSLPTPCSFQPGSYQKHQPSGLMRPSEAMWEIWV